ncbi:hypothetical protein ACFUC1_19600 [Pedococcus sp. NPDC057267]|uniref:hypothetical protein n=1 Tax=Pedococcus sp. NPDC057267 TaxID=3346077 RepID=UPI00362F7A1D
MSPVTNTPDLVPVLSAGKHRTPRKGACFMEMASFLAGEKWSDHPRCTHPLLASMARLVNDALSDEERRRIAMLVPDVVGLVGEDLAIDVSLAVHAAATALPLVSATRQNVLAVGLLTAERMLDTLPEEHADVHARCEAAFAAVPEAHAWAVRYARDARVRERVFRRQTAPHIVAYAVEGIAVACIDSPADHLIGLLQQAVADVRSRVQAPVPPRITALPMKV